MAEVPRPAGWTEGCCWRLPAGAVSADLGPLAADPPGQLDVLGHDGDPLGVDGAQVGVLEQADQVGLAGLLRGEGQREQWQGVTNDSQILDKDKQAIC